MRPIRARRCALWRAPVKAHSNPATDVTARRASHPRQHLLFVRSQPRPLLLAQFARRNLGEFVGARFSNQNRDLVVGRSPSVLLHESRDSQIALTAPLAELREQFRRDASDLEAGITPLRVALALDFVAEAPSLREQAHCDRPRTGRPAVRRSPTLAAPSSGLPCRRTSGWPRQRACAVADRVRGWCRDGRPPAPGCRSAYPHSRRLAAPGWRRTSRLPGGPPLTAVRCASINRSSPPTIASIETDFGAEIVKS